MATTSPDGLISPDASDPYDLTSDMAAMQASTQAALVNRASKSGSNSQMLNASGVQTGTLWFNTSEQRLYRYNGTGWDGVAPAPLSQETIPVTSGNSNSSGVNLTFRKYGNSIEVAGGFSLAGDWASYQRRPITADGAVPSGFRPLGTRNIPVILNSGSVYRSGTLAVTATGRVDFGTSDPPATSTAYSVGGVYLAL